MQLFKVEVGEVQKTGTLAVLVSKTKPLLKSMSGYSTLAEMTRLEG
jgi:hypothetical protein